jgi:redox-sensitive bicupin YhaK (pirin superfamily)
MITLRPAAERGHTLMGWLDSRHTFSFGEYFDQTHMGFRVLRVINDDRVAAGAGFPTHGHADMEIMSYVLSGALAHRDSLGTGSVIRPGDVQRMTAGSGVRHSEQNGSRDEPVHFLQIWITPDRRGLQPSYEQRRYDPTEKRGRLLLIASPDGREESVTIHQDVSIYATVLDPGEQVQHRIAPERCAWIQVASGAVMLDGRAMVEGDGAAIVSQATANLSASAPGSEVLVFDLP